MPCTLTGSLHGDQIMSLREGIDARERYLCAILRQLDRYKLKTEVIIGHAEKNADGVSDGEIQRWWNQHKQAET